MEPLPATFYGDVDQKNPVIATFENEIKQLLGFMRKIQKGSSRESYQQDYRRGSSTLFNIWVKYKPRLPASYYQEKLLKVGDSLVQMKEYRLALFQCYERYLEQFCSADIDDITDVIQFKSTFFPNGVDDKMADLTFHALQGRCICIYQLVKTGSGSRPNEESVRKCLKILSFLQLIMQVVLPQEHLCWLIYNGTLHIYTICRHLLVLGHSSKVLEFLLWASVCLESSVPLLSLAYLPWRTTLYTAVCQCYFDSQAGVHGEVFARRALSKINELSRLQNMSDTSDSEEAKKAFREATLKMAVMIFKRAVFESRRKPKGMLRPKQNINLKDLEKLPWPRTNTEKLLLEMFSSGAAQFLAILEALSDSNRHVLHAGPPVPDEPEIHDVIAELFFAGIDLLSGGGNKAERGAIPQSDLCKLLKQSSLLELAVEEKKYFSAEAVVKFAKLAFSYEQWDIFDAIIAPLYGFVKAENNTEWRKEELDLKILLAAETLLSGKKHKHGLNVHERLNNLAATWDSLGIFEFQDLQDGPADEHVILAETVFFCECNSFQDIQPDKDIVINVILFLWQKCKHGVQRIQAAASELSRFVHKCETNSKWIYILCLIYEVMQHSGFIDTDAVVMGEAALRLAGISESIADSLLKYGIKPDKSLQKGNVDSSTQMQNSNRHALLKKNPVTQLMFAYQILEKAIKGMSLARSSCATGDETSVVDHYSSWLSERKQHLKDTDGEQKNSSKSLANTMMMMDLQLELILTQHRVSVKLLNLLQGDARNLRSSKSFIHTKGNSEAVCFPTESELIAKMNKNRLSKAIFLMQKAVLLNNGLGKISPNQLLEESEKLIQRAEMEETAVYLSCVKQSELLTSGKKVPPPPILLCRTENSMKFRPAPFQSIVKVSWYCLYAQRVTGPNLKVRLNDHYLPGTGEKIPACSSNILEVKGLEANEKYIFAVAAYSSDGNLIGDAIGETTKPILAFPPLSIPATWAYLAQSSYHIGNYKVAEKSISILWNYFVLPTVSPPSDVVIVSASNETYISQKRICSEVISMCSPILLQLFLRSIFIISDINIKEGALFCDSICNNDVLQKFQSCRIAECERLLVALDLSILLNDVNYSLQAVVQCYGLIAPIIYHKIPSAPVVQVIIKCLAVLQEIPKSTWNKKQAGVTEGVLHMIACMTYYAVKVLRSWDEYELAIAIVEVGKQLLDITESTTGLLQFSEPRSTVGNDTVKAMDAGEKDKVSLLLKNAKKSIVSERVNEHLSALEHTLLTLKNPSHKSELTGKEDPALLSHVVTCWPLNAAYKEVMKFKKRSRFMEFFSLLLQRIVCEENFQKSLEWTTSVFEYLKRRDATNLGKSAAADDADVTVADDTFKRYTAGLVKYQKDEKLSKAKQIKQHEISTKNKERVKKQQKMKTSEQLRMSGEDPARTAFANLIKLLTPLVSRYKKNKRHTEICTEEMPWRSQVNLLLALTHFSLLRKKIDEQRSENLSSTQIINRSQAGSDDEASDASSSNEAHEGAILIQSVGRSLRTDTETNNNLMDSITSLLASHHDSLSKKFEKGPEEGQEMLIDRAHRALRPRTAEGDKPRDVIARLHYYTFRDKLLRALADSNSLEVGPRREAIQQFLAKLDLPSLDNNSIDDLTGPFTLDEIKAAILTLKPHKAPGPDGFTGLFFRTFSQTLSPLLLRLYREVTSAGAFLPEFLEANILTIPKDGKDPTLCGSYRPISLINVDVKIYAKVLVTRLGRHLPSLINYQILDPELFSLHHAGTVVMVTETNVKDGRISSPGHLHPSVKLALPFEGKLNDSYDVSGQTTKRSDSDTPRTQMTNDSETSSQSPVEQVKINIASGIILNHLGKTYIHLKRAMVLAHRGRHWTLLQNTCRILWNLTLELQLMLKQTDVTQEQFPITKDLLINEICMPLYFAAEFILDMMVILQNSGSIQILDSDEKFSVPSCMGSIELEEGGSSLAFEYPFDDITVVDMRWMCDLVLKAIEVLYNLESWESLIHIAIQFNLITHERYTEQVTPLLIHAQRVLITKIKDLVGSDVITPYLTKNGDDHNERVHCRNYIGKQLSVTTMAKKGVKPRASINQKEQIVYSADTWTKALVCVPLDVMDTLTCFRESMQKSKYSARALKHSRKLLSLFLANSQGLPIQERVTSLYGHSGRVSFTTGAMQAHQSLPPDLLEEDFHSVYSIESKAIPPSQLSAVIASYDRTIEILHSNNQQGLKAQALHELGNLHLCAGNKRAAFKCWCQALDETLNMSDALNSWQALDSSPDSISNGRSKDYSEKFLCRAGIWGCLQSAVITAKMSRYIFTSNINKKTECCILSAILFKALFRASLPHPKEDLQFALYDIGEDCEVSELVPGIDLFSDQYRADLNTVVGSLCFLISELHSATQNIMVLPLFTLYQYFVSIICRDPVRSIEGRLLKIKVLTDLHLFTEAFHELCLLTRGRRIPRRSQKGFKLDGKLEKIPKYIASKTILSSENLQALEELFNRKPSACLLSVCDHRLVNKVMLAKMYFIIKLSATINAIPETVMKSSYSMSVENTTLPSKDLKTHKSGRATKDFRQTSSLFVKEHLTFAELKGILLNEAEERLDFLIQAIQSRNNAHLLQYPAVELEMEIEAKLYLCEIAQQKYQSALSVALAYSAMRSLQDADIFTMKHQNTRKNVSSARKQHLITNLRIVNLSAILLPNLPCDTEAREHMNIGIWLRCRLSLITAVRSQLHGVAVQEEEVLDSLNIITEGIAEAETFSDIEMQAHLMLQAALLDIQEGRPRNSIRLLLENIIHLLEGKSFTSPTASLTLAQSLILLADLMEMENNDDNQELCTKQLDTLKLAHKLIIKELLSLGEAIEHHVTNEIATVPLAPLRNIYLPHINLLAEVKRRIGHVLSLKVCSLSNFNMDPSPWLPSLNLHTTALELSRMSAFREYNVEAELLFQKGKIERQMFMSGDHAKCLAIKTFAEAIKLSLNYNHNLGLIRKCYLEISLLYFHLASLDQNKTSGMECPTVEEQKIAASKGKVDNVKDTNGTGRRLKDRECYSILAWIAIRAATQVGSAILAYKVLVGQNVDTLQNLDENLYSQIPIFASADLLAKYKNYLKGEGQENDLSNLPLEMPSWVHLIRYHNHLLRLINVIHLTGFPKTMHEKLSSTDKKSASMLSNGLSLRFSVMHLFLKKHLCHYSACCANEFPQELLKGVDLQSESHKIFFESNQRQEKALSPKKVSLSVESKAEAQHEFVAMKSLDKELCVQWYRPSLERGSENRELTVMLIYAYNKNKIDVKNTTSCDPDNIFCGHKWIPLSRVVSLHEKLSVLKQKAEISLQYMTDSSVTEHGEKQKRSTQNAKNKADQKNYFTEELQEVIMKHCCEVQYLLNSQDPQPLVKAPFDITLPSLIRLETFFDLTHGCMLMKGSLLDWIVSLLI
ncbi:cilia- and flagella-associated protein 54 [Bombina bombina]|uniref:cilia- and flagella-associated protein 54 n=1 Tax=Bombina bombina TaxID=8345 RepID=UPI00235A8EC1|nr:cilia- and flagella-associated protein 54 [Bombina bombina]